jgi:hypothetical protein
MPTLLPIAPTLPPLPCEKHRGLFQFDCREGGETNCLASIFRADVMCAMTGRTDGLPLTWSGLLVPYCLSRDSISGQSTRPCTNVGGHRNLLDRGQYAIELANQDVA